MKKIIFIYLFCLGISLDTFAQRPMEKIETARIAFLTERLSLTPETAQQFWPVYNQFVEQRRELKKEDFQMRLSLKTDSLTDANAQQLIDKYFSLKEREVALEQEMVQKVSEVLSPSEAVQLIQAEAEFQRMVLRKLGERRRGGSSRPDMRR